MLSCVVCGCDVLRLCDRHGCGLRLLILCWLVCGGVVSVAECACVVVGGPGFVFVRVI